ncbi:MAG: host cell division inhibitor Icd-like protein, partial [Hafnia sp.]
MSDAVNHNMHPMHKKGLPVSMPPVYRDQVPAKSGARIGVLKFVSATHDAPSVFFVVEISVHLSEGIMGYTRFLHQIMVGWMGASSGAPVSDTAGYANPVQSITSEIGVSGDGFKTPVLEAAIMMATTPTHNPQFIWIIAAVRRDCPTIKPVLHHILAVSEREARRTLARDHVCF